MVATPTLPTAEVLCYDLVLNKSLVKVPVVKEKSQGLEVSSTLEIRIASQVA